jgi:hypothetical protein
MSEKFQCDHVCVGIQRWNISRCTNPLEHFAVVQETRWGQRNCCCKLIGLTPVLRTTSDKWYRLESWEIWLIFWQGWKIRTDSSKSPEINNQTWFPQSWSWTKLEETISIWNPDLKWIWHNVRRNEQYFGMKNNLEIQIIQGGCFNSFKSWIGFKWNEWKWLMMMMMIQNYEWIEDQE